LIFCRTKQRVNRLTEALKADNFNAEGIHRDLTLKKRQKIIDQFIKGEIRVCFLCFFFLFIFSSLAIYFVVFFITLLCMLLFFFLGMFACFQCLVSTEVMARGIDVPGLPFVVNYDVPVVPQEFVHRIGRTGI
jgi:ATP-dependent RNA helicase RhlE